MYICSFLSLRRVEFVGEYKRFGGTYCLYLRGYSERWYGPTSLQCYIINLKTIWIFASMKTKNIARVENEFLGRQCLCFYVRQK
jgi:hypothetical protein